MQLLAWQLKKQMNFFKCFKSQLECSQYANSSDFKYSMAKIMRLLKRLCKVKKCEVFSMVYFTLDTFEMCSQAFIVNSQHQGQSLLTLVLILKHKAAAQCITDIARLGADGIGVGVDGLVGHCMGRCMGWCMGAWVYGVVVYNPPTHHHSIHPCTNPCTNPCSARLGNQPQSHPHPTQEHQWCTILTLY